MTQKELSYVEDAIAHETNIIKICEETVQNIEDEEIVSFLENHIQNHISIKQNLLNLLEEKSNEWSIING